MSLAANYVEQTPDDPESVVREYAPLVKRIAHHLAGRLPPLVQVSDLIQVGMIGLLDAAANFNPGRGANFATYAGIRIRGAMIDEVRRNDWTPRSVRGKAKTVHEAIGQIEQKLGREAKGSEVAQQLGIPLTEYQQMLGEIQGQTLFSFDSSDPEDQWEAETYEDDTPDPEQTLDMNQQRSLIAGLIDGLPEREKLVISLYYDEELNLKEIGEVLGVSESRVCQIQNQAIARLKSRLGEALRGQD
jgi:RNA polymerase sigma factor for flagellar operon FliA